jgi:cytochrome c-type biogenesis protein CcmH/NrfG
VVVVAAAILFLTPAVLPGNKGGIQAQQALYRVRTTGTLPAEQAAAAVANLNQALEQDPDRAQFYGFLGSLYAWQGAYDEAVLALQRRAGLDGPQALERYAPFTRWQRQLAGEPAPPDWESTSHLYSQWMTRFPDRAEAYILLATARQRQGQASAADGSVRAGVEQGAEPGGLLTWYQANH